MSVAAVRTFEDYDASTAVNKPMPLSVGITSPSGGGKTYSALRLATGMQRIVGGEIYGIDTESDRMLHYRDRFKFRHVPFPPPHSPADYERAIDHCLAKGAKVIIIDSMSHEHTGEGGLLDMIDDYLERRAGDDENKRERLKWTAQIEPKGQRRRLNRKIVGAHAFFILCYRAQDKTKPVSGGKPIHLGWQAETTSPLPYDMTVRFLLPPGSDGRPNLTPDTEFEKLSIKSPIQFREWFRDGFQLTEEVGEKLARWAIGEDAERSSILEEIRSRLADLAPADRSERLQAALGVTKKAEVEALPLAALRAGLDALRGTDSPGLGLGLDPEPPAPEPEVEEISPPSGIEPQGVPGYASANPPDGGEVVIESSSAKPAGSADSFPKLLGHAGAVRLRNAALAVGMDTDAMLALWGPEPESIPANEETKFLRAVKTKAKERKP